MIPFSIAVYPNAVQCGTGLPSNSRVVCGGPYPKWEPNSGQCTTGPVIKAL